MVHRSRGQSPGRRPVSENAAQAGGAGRHRPWQHRAVHRHQSEGNSTEGGRRPPERVQAVFFDFGGVFINSPFAAAADTAVRMGIPEDELLELVFGPYDVDGDHPWHRMERGELSFADANTAIAELSVSSGRGRIEPMEVLHGARRGSGTREFMVDLARQPAGPGPGHRDHHQQHRRVRLGLATIPCRRAVRRRGRLERRGPAQARPGHLPLGLRTAGRGTGGASVFIDDHHGNVLGARAIGMHAVWCGLSAETTRAAADELLALLG